MKPTLDRDRTPVVLQAAEARVVAVPDLRTRWAGATRVLGDLLSLTKPRIGSFVVLAALTGALLAGGPEAAFLPAFG